MKKILSAVILLFLIAAFSLAAEEGRFLRYPSIHGDKIVFTYEGDLWLVGAQGGTASRITTFPGVEIVRQVLARTENGSPSRRPMTAPRPSI